MPTLHITRGLPASGKTTFARRWVAEDPAHRARVNRDDTRRMVHTPHAGPATETVTTTACHAALRALLRGGRDVICDDTNLNASNVKRLLRIAAQCGADIEWHDFPLPVDQAKTLDAGRTEQVGPAVIDRFAKYLGKDGALPARPDVPAPVKFAPYTPPTGAPKAVIVDIDGTLAHNYGHRSFYDYSKVRDDAVHQPIADLVWHFMATGHRPIIVSGRTETCRDDTALWLHARVGLEADDYEGPHMRPAGDNRDDAIVKLEIFDREIRDHYDVRYVLDDRDRVVAAWRSIGLTVLQVAEGDF